MQTSGNFLPLHVFIYNISAVMISQVCVNSNKQNSANLNAFSDFQTYRNDWFLPATETEKKVKEEKNHKLGMTIAASAIVLGFSVLALTRGLPKGLTGKTAELLRFLENKVTKFSDGTKNSRAAKIYEYSLKKVKDISVYFNSVNNLTTFKDIMFGKLMNKTKVTSKAAKNVTNLFEKFTRMTVKNGYEKAHYGFTRLLDVFNDADNKIIAHNLSEIITINGETKTAKEWLSFLSAKKLNMKIKMEHNFGDKAVRKRYNRVKDTMKGLDQKVLDAAKLNDPKNSVKNKELYDTFLPQSILEHDKTALKNEVAALQKSLLTGNEKDSLKEIMDIYRHLLPPEEFQKLERYYNKAAKKLDKAVQLETDKFFDKLRDLTLGSAPTDVLSIVTGLGTVGIGLTKSDDNNDRVSILLKYGIPALGAIATSLCLGAALISGGTALVLSTLSGLILNKIGTKADNFLEKLRESK